MIYIKSSLATHLSEETSKDASGPAGRRLFQGSTDLPTPTPSDFSSSQPSEGTESTKSKNKFDEYYSGFGMLMDQQ